MNGFSELFPQHHLNSSSTLRELQDAKAEWLHIAVDREVISRIHTIARLLGISTAVPKRDSWKCWCLRVGAVVVLAYRGSGLFLPEERGFEQVDVLSITNDDQEVVRYNPHNLPKDNLFLPGPWLDRLFALLATAARAQQEAERLATDELRRALLSEMAPVLEE